MVLTLALISSRVFASEVEVVNLFLTVSVSTETFVGIVTPVVSSTTIATEKVAVVGDPPTDAVVFVFFVILGVVNSVISVEVTSYCKFLMSIFLVVST